MSTFSGTADFTLTRNDVITTVLEVLHIIEPGMSPRPADITLLARSLNMIVKSLAMKGLDIWTYLRLTVPLNSDQADYTLGPGGGVVTGATITNGGNYGAPPSVTFSAPGGGGVTATGTAVLTGTAVTSITITNGGTKYTSRPTITFGSGTAAATARLSGIFTYRPLKILTSRSFNTSSQNETPMSRLGRKEYDHLVKKNQRGGVPVNFNYDAQLDNGILSIYPVPTSDTSHSLKLTVQRPLQDVNLSTENVDIPQECFLALQWALANENSLRYGCPMDVVRHIREQYAMHMEEFSSWDGGQDHTNIVFDVGAWGEGGVGGWGNA